MSETERKIMEGISAGIQQQVAESIKESASSPPHQMRPDELLRLENILLRKQIERQQDQMEMLRRELGRRDISDMEQAFTAFLMQSREINPATHGVEVDTESKTFRIVPR